MFKRDDHFPKDDIIAALRAILEYTDGMNDHDFLNSRITTDAVIRNFEIIGEAANYISPEFKLAHPKIKWQKS